MTNKAEKEGGEGKQVKRKREEQRCKRI